MLEVNVMPFVYFHKKIVPLEEAKNRVGENLRMSLFQQKPKPGAAMLTQH